MYIAIVDDNASDREKIKECLEYVAKKNGFNYLVSEFSNALEFIGSYEFNFDIVFFDIEMPSMNGMDAAKELRKIDKKVAIVFVTNMAKYAIEGYAVEALDYILKPINQYDFSLKMPRIMSRFAHDKNESILVKTDNDMSVAINVSHIIYLEVEGHYVVYHTTEGDYSEYATLKSVEERIAGETKFVRCNRCYIVNLGFVDGVTYDYVKIGGKELIISRSHKKSFCDAYADYLARGTKK